MSRQNVMVVAFLCHGQMSLIHYSVLADLQGFIISSVSSLLLFVISFYYRAKSAAILR